MNTPINPLQLMPQWADINNALERVLEADEFFVFINTDGNCDYKTSDVYDKTGPKDKAKYARLMSEAAEVENLSHEFLPYTSKLAFKKLVAEGIVRCLEHEYAAAKLAFQAARSYLERRQNRQSRQWYLTAAVVVTTLLAAPFFIYLGYIAPAPLTTFTQHLLFVEAGFIGALFSIMWRMGKTSFDSDADRNIHQWEAAVRIIGGGIAATLVMLAVKAKMLLANFITTDNEIYAMLFLCMAAGALEKWVPSLIAGVGKQKLDTDSKD
jgi:hypothetical protein